MPDEKPLSPDLLRVIEQCCDQHEDRLRAGESPELGDAVATAPVDVRSALFRELLKLELAYRPALDPEAERARYRARFPDFVAIVDTVLDANELHSSTIVHGQLTSTTSPTTPPSPEGFILGELIGHGGMGYVYRARDERLDRDVAIKVLHERFGATSPAARRFVDEARITGQLQHPGIPSVHQIGTLMDGRPFLAMKLIKGRTLDELLKEKESFNRLGVFESICQAMGYAHARRVVHRDLKPANIMVGAFGEVQVMDWGLAKVRRDDESQQTEVVEVETIGTQIRTTREQEEQTLAGSVLGTPSYMAPEQAIGAIDQIDERSDVFGLGGIFCVLLTGRPPYVGTTVESTRQLAARAKLNEAFADLDQCAAEPEFIALCKRCLAAEKADRPADAGELATAVAKLRAASEERAKRAEMERAHAELQSREQRKRRKLALLAGGAIAATLLIGIVGTTIGLVRSELRRSEAETAQRNEHEQRQVAEANEAKAKTAEDAERRAKVEQATQRARAEKARDKTRQALDAMTSSVTGDSLTTQIEITPEQKRFLTDMLVYYREFASEKADSEESRQRIAMAAYRLGLIESRLGRVEEAIAAFRTARDICAALSSEFPDVAEYRDILGANLVLLGQQLNRSGKRGEADPLFREALSIREAFLKDSPRDRRHRTAMGTVQFGLGHLLTEQAKYADAERHHLLALKYRLDLANEFPDVESYQEDLATSYLNLGYLQAGKKLFDEAEAQYLRALEIQTKLSERRPEFRNYRQAESWSRVNLAIVLRQAGKFTDAEQQYRLALVILNKLVSDFPTGPVYRRDLATTHMNLGLLLAARQKKKDAEEQYRIAIAIGEKLVEEFPEVPDYQVGLGGCCVNLGRLIRDVKNPSESLPWLDKAVATLQPVVQKDPQAATARQFLRNAYQGRAMTQDELKQYVNAVSDWAKALEYTPRNEQGWFQARYLFARARAGEIEFNDAITGIGEFSATKNRTSFEWYARAMIYAYGSSKFPDKKHEYADIAMESLQNAVRAGDVRNWAKDTDLDPLRERDDFKKFLETMQEQPPKKPGDKPKGGK